MPFLSVPSALTSVSRLSLVAGVLFLAACQPSPNEQAMRLGSVPESAVSVRALETRRFDTTDERHMLAAATQTLQDLGFTVTETSSEVGLLVGTKQRDAVEAGEVAAQVALTLFVGLLGGYHDANWDKEQSISATLVVMPVGRSKQTDVRVSFDRLVVRTNGMKRAELIQDPEIYRVFFEKLSAAVFLEAHDL